jgi:hypothetical protein
VKNMTEQTPIFDALIASLGNPVPVPAIDRSYASIQAQALHVREAEGVAAVPAPAAPRKSVAAAGRKTAS